MLAEHRVLQGFSRAKTAPALYRDTTELRTKRECIQAIKALTIALIETTDVQSKPSTIHQVAYIISIRSEYQHLGSPIFRGTLETAAGQKFEFSTLAELNGLLCEIGGWIDTPQLTTEAREAMSEGGNHARTSDNCPRATPQSG